MRIFTLTACLLLLAVAASASFIDPPANLVVVRGGMDWVWAAPCAAEQPSCGATLTLHDGYQIPTAAEWTASFANYTDVYNAFNLGPGGELCAAAYFDSGFTNCDPSDVQAGYIWGAPQPISNSIGGATNTNSDSFLVREGGGEVPEPSTYALIGLGLAALFARRRRS